MVIVPIGDSKAAETRINDYDSNHRGHGGLDELTTEDTEFFYLEFFCSQISGASVVEPWNVRTLQGFCAPCGDEAADRRLEPERFHGPVAQEHPNSSSQSDHANHMIGE